MRAVDYDRDISRAYRSSRFRKRLNTNARPASLESNYLEILSPSTRYACTFAIINDPDPARSLTALVDRGEGRGGGRLLSPRRSIDFIEIESRLARDFNFPHRRPETFRLDSAREKGKFRSPSAKSDNSIFPHLLSGRKVKLYVTIR